MGVDYRIFPTPLGVDMTKHGQAFGGDNDIVANALRSRYSLKTSPTRLQSPCRTSDNDFLEHFSLSRNDF